MTTIRNLMQILDTHGSLEWLHIETLPRINDENTLIIEPMEPLYADDEITLHYFYWHHLNENFPKNTVYKAIETKDFKTFKELYDEWEYKDDTPYMSGLILIHLNRSDEYIGELSGIWLKEIFDLIDEAEYECG